MEAHHESCGNAASNRAGLATVLALREVGCYSFLPHLTMRMRRRHLAVVSYKQWSVTASDRRPTMTDPRYGTEDLEATEE